MSETDTNPNPLGDLDEWEEFLKKRYPDGAGEGPDWTHRKGKVFRDYRAEARPSVREFYRLNHMRQTLEFVRTKKKEFLSLDRRRMGVWEAIEYLNELIDDSDPDTEVSQLQHLPRLRRRSARRDIRVGSCWPVWFTI